MGLDIDLCTIAKDDLPEGQQSEGDVGLHWDYSDIDSDRTTHVAYYRKKYDIRDLFDQVLAPVREITHQLAYYEVSKESIQKALEIIAVGDGTKDYCDLKDVLTTLLQQVDFETHTVLFDWIS